MFWSSTNKNNRIDFVGVGVQKSGTTALDFFLRKHPEIGMPISGEKELHFFDKEVFPLSLKSYKEYHKKFDFSNAKKMYGEITPVYCFWDNALKRIWEYNPDIKIIVIFRNPVDRAFSHWNMEVQRGREVRSFSESIREERTYVRRSLPYQDKVATYVSRGFYVNQIRNLRRFFPEQNLHFIKYEDFRLNQEQYLEGIYSFLGVDKTKDTYENKEIHSRTYKEEITELDKKYLIDLFEHEISGVEKELSWECLDWRS